MQKKNCMLHMPPILWQLFVNLS